MDNRVSEKTLTCWFGGSCKEKREVLVLKLLKFTLLLAFKIREEETVQSMDRPIRGAI